MKTKHNPVEILRSINWPEFKRELAARVAALEVMCTHKLKDCPDDWNDRILEDLAWPNFMLLVRFCQSFSIEGAEQKRNARQPPQGS